MKLRFLFTLALLGVACVFSHRSAFAVTFTNNTTIGLVNLSHDGSDIVVSNCTVTVDGPHAFASLLVAAGGVLTHTSDGTGSNTFSLFQADEPQLMVDTNLVSLVHSNVYAFTIEVWNTDKTLSYANGADYVLTADAGGVTWLARTTNSAIPSGTNVLVSYGYLYVWAPSRVDLTVAGDVTVAAGGAIRADGRGYSATSSNGRGSSAGSPASGGGGGNAGGGGTGSTNSAGGAPISGSFQQPTTLGGTGGNGVGGNGGKGGGGVLINCDGTLTLNGEISANGANATNSRAGGGAGGSVWILATNFTGAGSISANGGAGEPALGGGGGGGRISIAAATNSFTGGLRAGGGVGWKNGGAGTVFVQSTNASLVVDNAGLAGTNSTPLGGFSLAVDFDVTIRAGAVAELSSSSTLANLTVGSNGTLKATSGNLQVTATRDLWVQPGGVIHADGLGYAQNTGTGFGRVYNDGSLRPCSGGGYGGPGGNSLAAQAYGGSTYGTQTFPASWGSGGGGVSTSIGGSGGGYVRLAVSGALIVDGRVSADGQNGAGTGGGGGAGGSVYFTGPLLSGSGLIFANGGSGVLPVGGGGGGGRVFLGIATNFFAGNVTAYGGSGLNPGGAGTILTQPFGQPQQLVLDNGGRAAGLARTPLQYIVGFDLTLRGGAVASINTSFSFLNVTIETNSWLTVPYLSPTAPYSLILTVTSNAYIHAGGGITTDGLGYGANTGPGRGYYSYVYLPNLTYYVGSGGGHGGFGGNSITNTAAGGAGNDSSISIIYAGSGGGGLQSYSTGGPGGGLMQINVGRTLALDGKISANGANGLNGGGGGAGGGIRLTVNTLTGTGQVTANGGDGSDGWGGGGGGGRIYVIAQTNTLNGMGGLNGIAAFGGGGAFRGGAGTVAFSSSIGSLYCDNNGNRGTNTLLDTGFTGDLTVANGAVALHPGVSTFNYRSILVRSNAALVASVRNSGQTINVSSNVVIEAGGVINWDGMADSNTGGGSIVSFGGGGHGGAGGNNPSGNGTSYGSITSPQTLGSQGGRNSNFPSSQAGFGGGALRLNVSGTLQVDGQLSVRGLTGVLGNSPGLGGGSGGSLWLSLNRFVGAGLISADGGAGLGSGGGGGGRIAITWNKWMIGNSNVPDFSGVITARGGSGSVAGGAGTVYLKRSDETIARLLVENGGLFGTNTPLGSAYGMPSGWFDLTVASGAQTYFTSLLTMLNNLHVSPGGLLTMNTAQSALSMNCQSNVTIAAGGIISMDGRGFIRGAGGFQAGGSVGTKGAGGGHAGSGGASSSGAAGGGMAGSATQPTTFGGGGGAGANNYTDGCEGGGAIRLIVPGTLTVDGLLSASGRAGVQDDSGGGAGGSIWITANALAGSGVIAADGGDGDFYGGGGGGAGRIALYANNTNAFNATMSALGGDGASAGQNGSIVFTTNMLPLQITSQSPSGIVSNVVGFVDFNFSSLLNPATVSTGAFTLVPPAGSPVPAMSAALNGAFTARLSFTPSLNVPGDYTVTVNQGITDIFGAPLSQVHTGAFTIALPTIQGTVSDAGGGPIAGVQLQPDGGFLSATTDQNGHYALGVPPGWNGIVTPALGTYAFEPGSLSYSNVTATLTNQNYLLVTPNIVERIYALTTANQLISFDSTAPGKILSAFTVMGLQANEQIVGIDFWNGTLYGLGNLNHLYTINRANGAAGLVGSFSPVLNGQAFGFEAEPAGLRVVSELDQDLLLAYATGAATTSATLNGSPNPNITGLAYSSGNGKLYAADYFQNTIGSLDSASGLVTTIGPAGIDFSRHNGFDISPNLGRTAYLASPAASSDPAANLYKINLASGSATLVGLVGLVGDNTLIRGLSVAPGYTDLTPANVIINATGNLLTLSWPADRMGWRLETQTNTLATGLGTNWFTVSESAATNQVSISIGTQNDSVFFRLVYP